LSENGAITCRIVTCIFIPTCILICIVLIFLLTYRHRAGRGELAGAGIDRSRRAAIGSFAGIQAGGVGSRFNSASIAKTEC
jgi:hypothetical protein